jgi:hypothetical protein
MGLSKIRTHQHSRLTWRVISGDKEKILKNCQNEPTSKTNSNVFLKFQVDSAPVVQKKIARTNVNNIWSCGRNLPNLGLRIFFFKICINPKGRGRLTFQ